MTLMAGPLPASAETTLMPKYLQPLSTFEVCVKVDIPSVFSRAPQRFAPTAANSKAITGLCLFFAMVMLFAPASLRADEIASVTIQGIEDRLYDNVALFLSIKKHVARENVSYRRIQELHEGAVSEIRKALEPYGYYAAEIDAELSRDQEGWHAVYEINPGPPVRIAEVTIDLGVEPMADIQADGLKEAFPLKKGDVLVHPLYRSGKKRILQQLFDRGYIRAQYSESEIRVNVDKNEAHISLLIDAGGRFYFGRTIFDQDLLDPEFLEGFLNFEQGEPYSTQKLLELQQILYRTNYFGQVVVRGQTEAVEGDQVPVVVRLSDPDFFNRYTFGIGYATDVGVRGRAGWDNRLINRQGHTISSELKLAQQQSNLNFIYAIPVNDPRYNKMLLGSGYTEESWEDTDIKLFKGGASYDHSSGRYKYGVGLEFRNEEYEVGAEDGQSFLAVPTLRWSAIVGDEIIYAENGMFFSINLKGASETLLGDATFLQGLVSGKLITSPVEGLRLIGRFSLGATAVDSVRDLPPSLRFYAGGDQSVRGYDYKELGTTDASGITVGGKYLVVGSLEIEKRLFDNWGVAAFFDTGKGINSLSEDLSKGVGVGVRYKLPFGQIRVDVASALSKEDNPLRLHLTLGADF